MRRQEILDNIEKARREREAVRQLRAKDLEAEKNARLAEIEKMKQAHISGMKNMTEEQRAAAEAQFNAEKARLESEFNEKMVKAQLEAAPSDGATSPARLGNGASIDQPVQNVRLKPQGVAKVGRVEVADRGAQKTPREQPVSSAFSPKKSGTSSQAAPSPVPSGTGNRLSLMQTADEASALDNSILDPDQQSQSIGIRDFNEIDVLGTLDRDEKGNIIVPVDERTGAKASSDKLGRPINHYGFLIDPESGAIVHERTGQMVFPAADLDERGNIPMPYAIEKFNFNPFDLLGTFFFDDVEDPLSF